MSKSSSAETAVGPMVIAAVEQALPPSQRIVDDPYAIRILPKSSARIVAACRWSVVRRLLVALSETAAPGAWGGMLGRKRFLEDQAKAYVEARKGSIVVLGAGLDTKAATLVASAGMTAFEIDQAANIALKRDSLQRAFGGIPEGLHLISVDFEQADLEVELAHAGFDISRPALYLWEGVTQYLSKDAIGATMAFLSRAAPGSWLAFTYVLADFVAGKEMHGAQAIYKRLVEGHRVWTFGLDPAGVPDFLAAYGWRQREHVGGEDYGSNYFAPAGRDMPIMRIERAVLAEKL